MRFFFILLFVFASCLVSAQKKGTALIDSLVGNIALFKEDTNKLILLEKISYAYSTINPDSGIKYGQQIMTLAEKLKWPRGVAKANNSIAINYEAKSNHEIAIEYYLKALKIYEMQENKGDAAAILSGIGLIYTERGNYPQALEYSFKALKNYEDLGSKKEAATAMENIGTTYFEQKKYTKALEYYTNALNIYKRINYKEGIATNFGNMAMVFNIQGNYVKSLEYNLMALKVDKELDNRRFILANLANIGYAYFNMKKYDKALNYQLMSLKMSEELGNKRTIGINLGNIGEVYFTIAQDSQFIIHNNSIIPTGKMANINKAISYLEKGVVICKDANAYGPFIEFSKYLSDAYSIAGDYKKAFECLQQHITIKDSVFSDQNGIQIANLEANRQIEIKKQEVLIKDKQIQINELLLSQKRNERVLYIVCIALLLTLVCIILKSLHVYRKSNRILMKEKMKHLDIIEEQIERIKKQTTVLNEISHMQAHDVRGPVATILGLVQLFNFEDYTDPTNKVAIDGIATITKQLDEAVKEVIKKENSLDSL